MDREKHLCSIQYKYYVGACIFINTDVEFENKLLPLFLQIHLKSVDHSTCTCKRGVHPACSHHVALLLHGMKHISSTNSACSWRAPKRIEPTTSSVDMIYPSRDYDPCEDLHEEDKIWFREELKKLNRYVIMLCGSICRYIIFPSSLENI